MIIGGGKIENKKIIGISAILMATASLSIDTSEESEQKMV